MTRDNPQRPRRLLRFCRQLALALTLAFLACPGVRADHPNDQEPEEPEDDPPECPGEEGQAGDPVYLATGEFYWEKTFLRQESRLPFRLYFRYGVFQDYSGPVGHGWTFGYNNRLYETDDPSKPVVIRMDNGRRVTFETNASPNVLTSLDQERRQLTVNPDGTYTMRTRRQMEYHYDREGRLARIADGKGAELSLAYDPAGKLPVTGIPAKSNLTNAVVVARDYRLQRVEEKLGGAPTGRFFTYRYDETGHLADVTDQAGRQVTLSYTMPNGDLARIVDVDQQSYEFTYDAQRRMETFVGRGCSDCTVRRNQYVGPEDNRLAYQVQGADKQGERIEMDYSGVWSVRFAIRDTATGRTLRNRTEFVRFAMDVYGQKQVTNRYVDLGSVNHSIVSRYDPATGFLQWKRLPNGSTNFFGYDAAGNLLAQTNQAAPGVELIRQYRFDSRNNRTRETVWQTDRPAERFVTLYEYDTENRLAAEKRVKNPGAVETLWEFAAVRYEYYPNGLLRLRTDARGNSTAYEYNRAGLLAREFDPANPAHQTMYDYDARGFRTSLTNALGHAWHYQYDDAGRLTRELDPLGAENRYEYANGNLVSTETGRVGAEPGRITRFAYNGVNQRVQVSRVDDEGVPRPQYGFHYDSEGHVLDVTNALGQVESYTYHDIGWLLSHSRPWTNRADSVLTYGYDAAGRRVLEQDPLGVQTVTSYDALDRVTSRVEAVGTPVQRSVAYRYDAMNNVVETTYTGGTNIFTTTYTHDALGRRVQIAGDREYPRTFEYDDNDNLTAEIDGNGNRTEYVYDGYNRRIRIRHPDRNQYLPDGNDTVLEYDLVGNRVGDIDGRGNRRFTHFDALGRTVAESLAVAPGETLLGWPTWWQNDAAVLIRTVYNPWGQQTLVSNIVGAATSARYDCLGRLTNSVSAGGLSLLYRYDALDNVTNVLYPPVIGHAEGTSLSYAYHPYNGRLLQTAIDRAGDQTTLAYDRRLQVASTVTPFGGTNTTTYDELGRIASVTDAVSNTTHFRYNQFGQRTAIVHPDHAPGVAERIEYLEYNHRGLVTNHFGAGAHAVASSYDAVGNRTSLRDGNGNLTRWAYDARGRFIQKTYADGTHEDVSYDASGNVATHQDARGVARAYAYDSWNRRTNTSYSSGLVIRETRDSVGRVQRLEDAVGTNSWGYNAAGWVLTNHQGRAQATLLYAYSPEGHRISREVLVADSQEWRTRYEYDGCGRLGSVYDSELASGRFEYGWTNGNRLALQRTPPGIRRQKRYDTLGRLQEALLVGATGAVQDRQTYQYNRMGQLSLLVLRGQQTNAYTYDVWGQLAGVRRYGADGQSLPSYSIDYQYDAVGNLVTSVTAIGKRMLSVNSLNQCTAVSQNGGTTSLSYDEAGNLTEFGTLRCDWNEAGLMAAASADQTAVAVRYDGHGRAVETIDSSGVWQQTNVIVYDGVLPIAVLGEGTRSGVRLIRGPDLSGSLDGAGGIGGVAAVMMQDGTTKAVCFPDWQGNIGALFDGEGGEPLGEYSNFPFGELDSSPEAWQPFEYASKRRLGRMALFDFGARVYSTDLGRWLSRDPLGEVGGVNLYGFSANDPVNKYDAFGFRDCSRQERSWNLAVNEAFGEWLAFSAGLFELDFWKPDWFLGNLIKHAKERFWWARAGYDIRPRPGRLLDPAIMDRAAQLYRAELELLDVALRASDAVDDLGGILRADKRLQAASRAWYQCLRRERRNSPCSSSSPEEPREIPRPAHYGDMVDQLGALNQSLSAANRQLKGITSGLSSAGKLDEIERLLESMERRTRDASEGLECFGDCDPPTRYRPIGEEGVEFY